MINLQNTEKLSFVSLIGLALSVFLGKSYLNTLQAMDSSVYARLALDATREGGLPKLPIGDLLLGQGHWVGGFNDHPFTLIWLNGWVMRILGPDTWSARLLPALLAVGCVITVYAIAKRLYQSSVVGLIAGLITLCSPLLMSYGGRFHLDSTLLFGVLLSFYGWVSGSNPLTLLGTVIAVWVKGPLGFLLYPAIFLSGFVSKTWDKKRVRRFLVLSCFALLLGGGIWMIIATLGHPGLVADYWKRFVMGQVLDRGTVPTLPILFKLFLKWSIWTVLLAMALLKWVRKKRFQDESLTLPLIAAFLILILVTGIRFKYEHYFMPMFPFFALFIAGSFKEWLESKSIRIQQGIIALGLMIPPVLLASPIDIGVEKFPQLKVFIPYIQSNGTCRDTVVFVEGSQPYGSIGDYAAVLQFYTNRHTIEARCENLSTQVSLPEVKWVIASAELLDQCTSDAIRKTFVSELSFGKQTLYTRYPLKLGDLTPLAQPYRAVADCELPKPRESRYFR